MKLTTLRSPLTLTPFEDPICFLARYFKSSRTEVLQTLEHYATGPETLISFIHNYSQPAGANHVSYQRMVHKQFNPGQQSKALYRYYHK